MDKVEKKGIYLYKKNNKNQLVLKELIQLLKSQYSDKTLHFSYIESESSLLPKLSLWENLQLVTGSSHWREFCQHLSKNLFPLLNMIKDIDKKSGEASSDDKLIVSLITSFYRPGSLLIDINEDLLAIKTIQEIKRILLSEEMKRPIFMATANSGLWLDSAHTLVEKKGVFFECTLLDDQLIKKHWAA